MSSRMARHGQEEAIEYRLLFGASYAVFLVAAVAGRLLPWRWRQVRQGIARHQSIFGEARAAANICVPFAFMR